MNWPDLIKRLQAQGLTQVEVARRCGVAQSTVSDLAGGRTKSPGFELGAALLRLVEEPAMAARSASAAVPQEPTNV
jgi:transcriptional regulator with XRE-family HTH domain